MPVITDLTNGSIEIAELQRRLDKKTMRLIIRQLSKPVAPDLSREDWNGAQRMLNGQPTRGDHSKFSSVVMAYMSLHEPVKVAFESWVQSRGKETEKKKRNHAAVEA